jgi:hypothetical protein
MSGIVVTPVTNILPLPNDILRLTDFSGRDGILQSIRPADDGWLLVDLSGVLVELPESLGEELRALMGQPTRAAHYFGAYRVARWTGRAPA